LKQNMLNI